MAGVEASWPPVRPSDADRDRVLRALREAAVEGRLSDDTFLRRVEDVLRTHSAAELARLVSDLPRRRSLSERLARRVAAMSAARWRVQRSWTAPRLPRLALPVDRTRVHTLGRAGDCDLRLDDEFVSRHHAVLRPTAGGWELVDLHSTNGTRVNGWRVAGPHGVRPGDVVTLGRVTFAVTGSASTR
jgi:hypothetical protein